MSDLCHLVPEARPFALDRLPLLDGLTVQIRPSGPRFFAADLIRPSVGIVERGRRDQEVHNQRVGLRP
jgi:hypothetical protein